MYVLDRVNPEMLSSDVGFSRMTNLLRSLRAISDPTRLRLLALLQTDELSVNELQEITGLAQSRISTHLGHLLDCEILTSRREGKRSFYSIRATQRRIEKQFLEIALQGSDELETSAADKTNLKRILNRRKDLAQLQFNKAAGRFGRVYGPGRSWEGFGQALLRMLPAIDVADLGSGEGILSQLLAHRCHQVIAIDNSRKIVDFGQRQAAAMGLHNLEFRCGDLQDPPLEEESIDVAIMSQSLHHAADPERAIVNATNYIKPGGQLLILDLAKHEYKEATSLYGDLWLGFHPSELAQWLEKASFQDIEVSEVARDKEAPYLRTLLAAGTKPIANEADAA